MGIIKRMTAWGGSDDQALRKMGDDARDARSWPEAAGFYTRYLEHVPEDSAIWVQLGHAHKESGDLESAQRAYLRALSIEPGNPDTHVQIGHVEKLQGNLNQALAHYRKAIELDPKFTAALEEFERFGPENVGVLAVTAAPPAATPEAHSSDTLVELDKRLKLIADQVAAVKAVAFEVQKLRRRMDDLDRHVAELGERVTDLASRSDTARSDIDRRVSSLEGQSPSVQGRFSALVEHFGTITACKRDLDRQAALIDELMRRQRPS